MLYQFELWKFLAGLGIFLFGMFLLEESVRQLSGRAFRRIIKKATTGKIRSITTGMFSTAVLQSSSAVSLMTLAFAGAGIMSMQNAVGVIFGTNIGTTFTGWIIAAVGFKLNIEGISLPLIGIGGLGLILLSQSPRYSGFSKLSVAFGFLFMGLDYMKTSVENFAGSFDLATIPHYGIWFYVLIGFILTALVQSSSATIAIILTALNGGIIYFSEGAAMVIGANIGTTVTVMLGAIGAGQIKKQIALSHLIFNVTTGVIAFLILPIFVRASALTGNETQNYVLGIALFHTFFNVLGVALFYPFISTLVILLKKWLPDKSKPIAPHLRNISQNLPEAALHALSLELKHLYRETIAFCIILLHSDGKSAPVRKVLAANGFSPEIAKRTAEEQLALTRELHKAIVAFASNIQHGELEAAEKTRIHQLIHLSMLLSQASKTVWGIKQEIEDLEASGNPRARKFLEEIETRNLDYWEELLSAGSEDKPFLAEIKLEDLKARLDTQQGEFITRIASHLEKGNIKEKHAASLLSANGLLTESNRQLCGALDEFLRELPL
jgi:phosphate:Na+ symporter